MGFFSRKRQERPIVYAPQAIPAPKPAEPGQMPILASARTGLAGLDDAIVGRVPVEYSGKSLQDVIDYLTTNATPEQMPFADSIRKELHASGSVVVVNGKTASLEHGVAQYFVEKEHRLPSGDVKKYRSLEIEVSAVQQGGYRAIR